MKRQTGIISAAKSTYKKIDMFGQPTTFFYNGEEEFKSVFGSTLTILVVIAAFLLSMTVIKSALFNTDVEFKSDTIFYPDPEQTMLTTRDFHLAILPDDPTHQYNNSMFGVRVRWAQNLRLPNGSLVKNRTQIPMRLCTADDFVEFPDDFTSYGFARALCPTSDWEIPITGVFLSQVFEFIEIVVEECDPVTHALSGITCADEVTSDAYFAVNKVKPQIFFKNFIINPSNIDNPFQSFIDSVYYVINKRVLSKSVDIFVRESQLDSYQDFINSEAVQTNVTYRVDPVVSDQIYTPTRDPKEMLSVQFRMGTTKMIYTRNLVNLADLAAYFGGIWGVLYSICSIAAAAHNSVGYQKSLADSMFRFENVGRGNQGKKPSAQEKDPMSPKRKPGKGKKKTSNADQDTSQPQMVDNMLSKGVLGKQKAFGSTLSYILAKVFCIRRKGDKAKLNQQDEGLQLAKRKVDVMYVLKKIQEFEKLKCVLLDKNQRALFDYIPPPLVVNKENQDQAVKQKRTSDLANAIKYYDPKNELMEKYKTAESILNLYNVYKATKHGDDLSRKLIEMLGFKVLTIFRYLDHMMADKEEIEKRRAVGLKRALIVMRAKLRDIREQKVLHNDDTVLDTSRNNNDSDDKQIQILVNDCLSPIASNNPFSNGNTPLISPNTSMTVSANQSKKRIEFTWLHGVDPDERSVQEDSSEIGSDFSKIIKRIQSKRTKDE